MKPIVEQLENREVPASINLMFNNFRKIFRSYNPSLDFTHDGIVNRDDWVKAKESIASHLKPYFPGYTISIASKRVKQLSVRFFGDSGSSVIGRALVGNPGMNFAGPARVFSDTLWDIISYDEPSPDEFAQAFAQIAAHELGHLIGLQHREGTVMESWYESLVPQFFDEQQKQEVSKSRTEPTVFLRIPEWSIRHSQCF